MRRLVFCSIYIWQTLKNHNENLFEEFCLINIFVKKHGQIDNTFENICTEIFKYFSMKKNSFENILHSAEYAPKFPGTSTFIEKNSYLISQYCTVERKIN